MRFFDLLSRAGGSKVRYLRDRPPTCLPGFALRRQSEPDIEPGREGPKYRSSDSERHQASGTWPLPVGDHGDIASEKNGPGHSFSKIPLINRSVEKGRKSFWRCPPTVLMARIEKGGTQAIPTTFTNWLAGG